MTTPPLFSWMIHSFIHSFTTSPPFQCVRGSVASCLCTLIVWLSEFSPASSCFAVIATFLPFLHHQDFREKHPQTRQMFFFSSLWLISTVWRFYNLVSQRLFREPQQETHGQSWFFCHVKSVKVSLVALPSLNSRKATGHRMPTQPFPAPTGCRMNQRVSASGGRSSGSGWSC